jgi:hypothetical protein
MLRLNKLTLASLLSIVVAGLGCCAISQPSFAVSGSEWKAGNIVSDSIFYDNSSMSISDIQNFLNNKVPSCDSSGVKTSELGGGSRAQYGASRGYPAPFVCVRNYIENPSTHENNLSTNGQVSGGWPAAMIIKYAADTYRINPKILLVTIQKESSMITDDWPLRVQYNAIMGYGCPDTGPNNSANCNSTYNGFYNQMMLSARQFRLYADNPQSYRYKPYQNNTILYNPNTSCGSSNVYIEGLATAGLYNYTPYQPNTAALNNLYGTGDGCSAYGNRNFWRMYNDWFGGTQGPIAYKAQGSAAIYLQIDGMKYNVPSMAVIQDYGISPAAIKEIPQTAVDAVPYPTQSSGFSTEISHVVKSSSDSDDDGGSIYLISVNKAYKFNSMAQFYTFGYKESDIRYLPLNYIYSKTRDNLSDYATSPMGDTFEFYNNQKRLILNYDTYLAKNPSDKSSLLSYSLVDKVASGKPLSIKPVLVKPTGGDSVYLYINDSYRSIPNYDVYSCWQFSTSLESTVYRITNPAYTQPISASNNLSCYVKDSASNIRLLLPEGRKVKATSILNQVQPYTLDSIESQLLSRIQDSNSDLRQFVKANNSAAIFSLDSGVKRVLTYDTFRLLPLGSEQIDTIDSGTLNSIVEGGPYVFDGQFVKANNSAPVYLYFNGSRYVIPYANLFEAYGGKWSDVSSFEQDDLNNNFPVSTYVIKDVIVDKSTSKVYLLAKNGRYTLNTDLQAAYNKNYSALAASQPYDMSVLKSIPEISSTQATRYVKSYDENLVYYVENGNRHSVNSYNTLLSLNGGKEPHVMIVSRQFIDTLTSSSSYN